MGPSTATKRKREDTAAAQRKGLPPPTRPKKEATSDADGEEANINSDLDDSDTDERQPLYNERMEALPEHPAWDLEWRNITEDNTATLEAVTDVIGEHGYGIDKLIHSLLWAAKISSDQGMKKPTYALVGPMGAGTCTGDELREPSDFSASKSSVLNAMLDKSIAVADVGEACTGVVIV
nr:hypothetical protein B0A51_01639 [Rachicladosporium sp. CCFEE 5018]